MNEVVATAALLALVVLASVSDLRTRRIPNALTVTGLGIALALRGAVGVEPLMSGLAGAAIAFAPAVPLVALGGLGGGDAKLLAAASLWVGPDQLLPFVALVAVFGGVLALILVEVLLLHLQSIPFTCSRVPGRANLTTVWTLYFLAFLMYVYTAARVGYWMQQAPLRLALGYAVVGLVLMALMLHRNQLLREDGTLVFEEEMEPAVRVLHLT